MQAKDKKEEIKEDLIQKETKEGMVFKSAASKAHLYKIKVGLLLIDRHQLKSLKRRERSGKQQVLHKLNRNRSAS